MIFELTTKARVSCDDGRCWTLEEYREVQKREGEPQLEWRISGHYGRLDQACSRALELSLFDSKLERILLADLVKRLLAAKLEILTAIQAIDPVSLAASRAAVSCPDSKSRKRDSDAAVKTLLKGKSKK